LAQHRGPGDWATLPLGWLSPGEAGHRVTCHRAQDAQQQRRECPVQLPWRLLPWVYLTSWGPSPKTGWGRLPRVHPKRAGTLCQEDPSSPRSAGLQEPSSWRQRKPLYASHRRTQGYPQEDKEAILLGTLASVTAPGAGGPHPAGTQRGCTRFVFSSFKRKMVGGPTGVHYAPPGAVGSCSIHPSFLFSIAPGSSSAPGSQCCAHQCWGLSSGRQSLCARDRPPSMVTGHTNTRSL
jgi:hypothetical protein